MADGTVFCNVTVENIGSVPGKEVIQLYFSAPQGKLGKPAIQLGAYGKTKLLSLDDFLDTLTLEEQVWLLGGQPNTGVATYLNESLLSVTHGNPQWRSPP